MPFHSHSFIHFKTIFNSTIQMHMNCMDGLLKTSNMSFWVFHIFRKSNYSCVHKFANLETLISSLLYVTIFTNFVGSSFSIIDEVFPISDLFDCLIWAQSYLYPIFFIFFIVLLSHMLAF